MEEIADAAGVTRMTVYRYFASRTDLLVETARHVDIVEGAARRFVEACQGPSGVDAIDSWTRVWTGYLPHIAPMARALLSARGDDTAADAAWRDRMTSLWHGPHLIAERLAAEGVLAAHLTVDAAADLMWAIASVQVWDALTNERGWSPATYQQHLSETLHRTLTDR